VRQTAAQIDASTALGGPGPSATRGDVSLHHKRAYGVLSGDRHTQYTRYAVRGMAPELELHTTRLCQRLIAVACRKQNSIASQHNPHFHTYIPITKTNLVNLILREEVLHHGLT